MPVYKVKNVKISYFGKRMMSYESFWKKCEPLVSFSFPWDSMPAPPMIFRALHDRNNFYFRFDVIDQDIHVEKGGRDKSMVLTSDRVEIFFRKDEVMKPYYCLEMDATGRILDYQAEYYRKFDYDWTWPGITIKAEFTLNGYRVWGSIPLAGLKKLGLLTERIIQAGLFRGKCVRDKKGESSFLWMSWMKPDSQQPDFHIPSAFGELVLE